MSLTLKILRRHSEGTEKIRPLLLEEINILLRQNDSMDPRILPLMIGTGLAAYDRWNLCSSSFESRLERLRRVPPGWRLEAISGSRFWATTMLGHPAPVRAWLVELHASAAALAWDTAMHLELKLGQQLDGLSYSLHALALASLINSLQKSEEWQSIYLKMAIEMIFKEYASGIAKNILQVTEGYYNPLIEYSIEHGLPGAEILDVYDAPKQMESRTQIVILMLSAGDLGKRFQRWSALEWENNIIKSDPVVMLAF